MGIFIDRLKNGKDTIKNPLENNKYSYGEIRVDNSLCNGCGLCEEECLVGAISTVFGNVNIEPKKCLFCGECIKACPSKALSMSNNYKLSSVEILGEQVKKEIYSKFKRSLVLRAVDVGSCNGCFLELAATQNTYYDLSRYGVHISASPRHADGLIVGGAVSINMKEALIKAYEATAEPKLVIGLGACSYDSGIFKKGYVVSKPLNEIIPVNLLIPGCPPSPQAIIEGILKIMGRV